MTRYIIPTADAPAYIRERRPFATPTCNLSGGPDLPWLTPRGWLTESERDAWRRDAAHIDYVVWSYFTPIAWHTDDGTSAAWHVITRTFSPTTRRHQGAVSDALRTSSWDADGRPGVDVVSFTPYDLGPVARVALRDLQLDHGATPYKVLPRARRRYRTLTAKGYAVETAPDVFALTDRGRRAH